MSDFSNRFLREQIINEAYDFDSAYKLAETHGLAGMSRDLVVMHVSEVMKWKRSHNVYEMARQDREFEEDKSDGYATWICAAAGGLLGYALVKELYASFLGLIIGGVTGTFIEENTKAISRLRHVPELPYEGSPEQLKKIEEEFRNSWDAL
jgi:hypothetical protein